MSSRCLSVAFLACVPFLHAAPRVLRVCADPNNLPFSNQAGQGLENRLAEIVSADLQAELRYVWWAERKNFLKKTLDAGLCDVVLGVPSTLDSVATTQPYYRSTYVFLQRTDRGPKVSSLNDSRLENMKIGIHLGGDGYAPPAHLLASRGIARQLVGFSLYGPLGEPDPPSRLVNAVANGDVDVAIVWGPFAGYFAKRQPVPLNITPVSPTAFQTVPFIYAISAAVRKEDSGLRDEIDRVLTRECGRVAALLSEYGIPQLEEVAAKCGASSPSAVSSR